MAIKRVCMCECSSSGGLCGYQLQGKQNACAHHREHGGHGYSGNAEELLRHHSSFTDSTATWQHKRTEPGIMHTPAARLTNYLTTHTHIRLMALCPGLPGSAGTRKVKPIWISLKQETHVCARVRAFNDPPDRQPCQQPTTQKRRK